VENRKIKDSWSKIKPDNTAHERILNNILERNYSGKTKKGKVYNMAIIPMRILAPIAACFIIALAIYIPTLLNNGEGSSLHNPISNGEGSIATIEPPSTVNNPSDTDDADTIIPGLPCEDIPEPLTVININELSEITSARLAIDLRPEDFVPMNKNEIIDFYGFDFFPSTIPADMKIVEEGTYGIYKRDEGTGEVYYSVNMAWYVDDNIDRQLQVNIDKGNLPHSCFAYLGIEYENSVINGTELLIGRSVNHSGTEIFVAEMMYAGNGIRIESGYLTQAEFVDAVTSLIQGLDETAQTTGNKKDDKNAEVINPVYQDEQISKVTSEQVRRVTDDMKFGDIIAFLGETANIGFGSPILQYEVDGDYLLNIAFVSLETPCGYSGEELLAQLIQK